jgi:hypothetical protein
MFVLESLVYRYTLASSANIGPAAGKGGNSNSVNKCLRISCSSNAREQKNENNDKKRENGT